MRRLKGIFLLGLRGQGGFFCFYVCSHQVPQVLNVFPKMFPIAPWFLIPYCSAMVPLPFVQVVMGGPKGCFYSGEGSIFRLLCWGVPPMFQKYWWWANQLAPSGKKKKELWVHPSLINKSMNKYPPFGTNWHPISRPTFLHNHLIDVWIFCPKTCIETHLWCREGMKFVYRNGWNGKKFGPFLDLCVSSLRRGHANLLCIVPILSDVSEETKECVRFRYI